MESEPEPFCTLEVFRDGAENSTRGEAIPILLGVRGKVFARRKKRDRDFHPGLWCVNIFAEPSPRAAQGTSL
jgi:hypothetical protein